jgi:hypothetical protein
MSFAGLFQEEVEGKPLSWEPRRFLDAIRNGATQEQALEQTGVSREQLLVWKTHLRFRKELKIAKRGEGIARFWSFSELEAPSVAPPPGTPDFQIEAEGWRKL